jgi:hypothetical protein
MISIRKVITGLLVGACLANLAYLVIFDFYYAYNMPRIPDPTTARISQITVNHGFVVYVTRQEKYRFQSAETLMGVSVIVIALIALDRRRQQEKNADPV